MEWETKQRTAGGDKGLFENSLSGRGPASGRNSENSAHPEESHNGARAGTYPPAVNMAIATELDLPAISKRQLRGTQFAGLAAGVQNQLSIDAGAAPRLGTRPSSVRFLESQTVAGNPQFPAFRETRVAILQQTLTQ